MKTIKFISRIKYATVVAFFVALLSSISSCRKYDEGGKYCLTKSHLTATWKLKCLSYNGNDVTSYLLVSDIKQTFKRNKDYSFCFTNSQGQEVIHNGKWDYEKATFGTFDILGSTSGTQPNITFYNPELKDSPLELVPGAYLKSTDNWFYIKKLKKKEFHYKTGSWEFWYEKE
jgi:hypothetical protein